MISGTQTAFFYRNTYFLLPQGYDRAESFIQSVRQSELPMTVQATILRENSEVKKTWWYELGVCIAPYFISDYLRKPESVVIEDVGDVYPVEIELLTQQEYNDRLRALVTDHCPGCLLYGGLDEKDSSLSGHFDEISLNGVCFYRAEGKTEPRCFHDELSQFISSWKHWKRSKKNAAYVMGDLKECKLSYSSGEIADCDEGRTLKLTAKKSSLLLTVLTDLVARRVKAEADGAYTILLEQRAEVNAASVETLLSNRKITATRKELKKYGVALAELTFDPAGESKMAWIVQQMCEEGLISLLHEEAGKKLLLMAGEAKVLMRLRYASPVLEPLGTQVKVYDALKTVRYRVSYEMPFDILDLAPIEEEKEKKRKPSKKQLKAQEGKILQFDQVEKLFTYIDLRLSESGCDHTLRFTQMWLTEHLQPEQIALAIEEIQSMGGFCDCEVILNCYEDYELDVRR